MVRYLSDEWLKMADTALVGLKPAEGQLAVAVTVTGGPEGTRQYRMVLGPDRVAVDHDVDSANVTMNLAWDQAVALARGEASAQRAFLDGRLRIGGDVSALLGHADSFASIDDRLSALRSETDFDVTV